MIRIAMLVMSGALAAFTAQAQTQTYSFDCITNNLAGDCAIGEAQFSVTVTDAGLPVTFEFNNTGSNDSSITAVYFDWTSDAYALPASGVVSGSTGVSFAWGASPENLPGGNDIDFVVNIAADSNDPTQPNGVNPGEWLKVAFTTT